MSLGTLYVNNSPRCTPVKALVESLGLDIKIQHFDSANDEFVAKFPVKKFPTFEGADGFKLHENLAIISYIISLTDDEKVKAELLGADAKEQANILKISSYFNMDAISNLSAPFLMLTGKAPYNKKTFDEKLNEFNYVASLLNNKLRNYTFLATENVTAGDIIATNVFASASCLIWGAQERKQYPNIVRYVDTVLASRYYKTERANYKFVDTAMTYTPPKKEKKEKKEKPAATKKEEKPAESEEAAPAKKPKHPLEALGKSTFVLDEWKRTYSNEDTRPVALPWFWEHYNPEEYSIWKVEYKYNDELTLTFMSNNLVGGFFNRLSGSVKYMFGCLVVYGENNSNGIVGAVMVRGQDFEPAFNVAPDWESYSYSKLDASKGEDKAFINNMWAWDEPVVVNGESKEIADGKVLK